MISENSLILLDTSILLHVARGSTAAEIIDSRYQLKSRPEKPLISVVTSAEIRVFARRRAWGADKLARLEALLRELVVVDINRPSIIERYAEIAVFAEENGASIGNNDLWIAASTAVTGAHLLTCDKDFDALTPRFLKREWINPEDLAKCKASKELN